MFQKSLFIITISLLTFVNLGLGQDVSEVDSLFEEIVEISPDKFDIWLDAAILRKKDSEKPLLFERLIKNRLRNGLFTSDDAIKGVLNSWIKYDWKILLTPEVSIYKIDKLGAVAFIDSVLVLLYKRPLLEINLRRSRQDLINQNVGTGYDNPMSNRLKLITLSNKYRASFVINYYKSCNELASIYLKQGRIEDAEKYFLIPLSYPYYIEEDQSILNELFDLYVIAGKGVLKCRANDLPMLKHTFFIQATRHILDPIKEEMIAKLEKGGKK